MTAAGTATTSATGRATPAKRKDSLPDTFGRCEGGEGIRQRPPPAEHRDRIAVHGVDGADGQQRPLGWPRRRRQAAPHRRKVDPGPGVPLEGTGGPWADGEPSLPEQRDEFAVRGSDGDGGLWRVGEVSPGPRDSGGRPRRPSPRLQTTGEGSWRDESTSDDRTFARDGRARKRFLILEIKIQFRAETSRSQFWISSWTRKQP